MAVPTLSTAISFNVLNAILALLLRSQCCQLALLLQLLEYNTCIAANTADLRLSEYSVLLTSIVENNHSLF